jgi:hypothetical protein
MHPGTPEPNWARRARVCAASGEWVGLVRYRPGCGRLLLPDQHCDKRILLVRINRDVRGNVHMTGSLRLRLWRRLARTCDFGGSAHRVECGKRYNVTMASRSFHIV